MSKIKNKKKFKEFKELFESWSGFQLNTEDLQEIKDEINSKKWTLECEVSEYADKLHNKLCDCFDDFD